MNVYKVELNNECIIFDNIPLSGIKYSCDISDDNDDICTMNISNIPQYFDIEINTGRPSRQFSVCYRYDTGDYSELIYRNGRDFFAIIWVLEEITINMNVPLRAENFTMEIRSYSYGITTFEITIKKTALSNIFQVSFLLFPCILMMFILRKKLNNV